MRILSQLKLDVDDIDSETVMRIEELIVTAREWCEGYQNRAYITQTFEIALDCWPRGDHIRLPRPPLQNIESLKYKDASGASETWGTSNYVADDFSEPGNLIKSHSYSWPSTRVSPNGIIVRYISGYGDAPDCVPERIKHAIVLLTTYWFENGVCEPPCAVYDLLDLERVVPL